MRNFSQGEENVNNLFCIYQYELYIVGSVFKLNKIFFDSCL